jgi:hypothetical protein
MNAMSIEYNTYIECLSNEQQYLHNNASKLFIQVNLFFQKWQAIDMQNIPYKCIYN